QGKAYIEKLLSLLPSAGIEVDVAGYFGMSFEDLISVIIHIAYACFGLSRSAVTLLVAGMDHERQPEFISQLYLRHESLFLYFFGVFLQAIVVEAAFADSHHFPALG